MNAQTKSSAPSGSDNEFANLGARLVRFGQALQEPSTQVSELMTLASACGIAFKLRVVAECEDSKDA